MRGRSKYIDSSTKIFVALLEKWPLLRVATKRGTTVLNLYRKTASISTPYFVDPILTSALLEVQNWI